MLRPFLKKQVPKMAFTMLSYSLDLKWETAAQAYEKVLAKDPQGQFTKDAAHGTL